MTHQLIKRGPRDFYCSVCHQSWQSTTKAYCPGVPVIAYKDKGGLMSKTEMDKRGYKTDRLPPPAPCVFRMTDGRNDVQYIKLYDPTGCARKKEVKHKLVHYVDHLAWPLAWMPFLEALVEWRNDRIEHKSLETSYEAEERWAWQDVWREMGMEVARMTSCLLAFTDEEIAALGETVPFTFDLMPIRTRWERRRPDLQQRDDLIEVLLKAYHRWWWQNRSPEEIAAHEAEAAARQARDRRYTVQQTEAARERRFEGIMTPSAASDAPPVQLSLFNEGEVSQ